MAILDAKKYDTVRSGRSFSFRYRVRRALWNTVWLLLAAWTPPMAHGWRRLLLRLFGAQLSNNCVVYGSARVWDPDNLIMGEFSCLGPRVICYSMARITLRDYAIVSQGAHLCAGTHDIDDPNFQLKAEPIIIGKKAWVAADAFVGPGVVIGEGAVLGARAVAFEDLDPWGVYTGNRAVKVRVRANALK
jgi:putative colanic acid biosynthesis acetyltransferase WcaF